MGPPIGAFLFAAGMALPFITQSVLVLLSLALFLTMFIMAPVGQQVYGDALQPLLAEQLSYEDAWKKGIEPVRGFMLRQMRDKDLELFISLKLLAIHLIRLL